MPDELDSVEISAHRKEHCRKCKYKLKPKFCLRNQTQVSPTLLYSSSEVIVNTSKHLERRVC